jgi:molecular chaperone GrpE
LAGNDAADPKKSGEPDYDGGAEGATEADVSAPAAGTGKLEAEIADLKSTLIRRQADFENFRKRVERERHEESRRVKAHLIEHLLPVLDTFERALAAHNDPAYADYRKGFELISRQLWELLAKEGLERIEATSKPFDPHMHQAIERVETDEHADGIVIEAVQPGYLFHGRVLRPATVRVAAAPAAKAQHRGN